MIDRSKTNTEICKVRDHYMFTGDAGKLNVFLLGPIHSSGRWHVGIDAMKSSLVLLISLFP